jgi:CRP/FNR family transcriptional regulator, cyclic AMP receptor protein
MLSTFEKILLLREVPFFRGHSSDELRSVAGICREVQFAAGDLIMRAGEEGTELFILEHGKVRIYSGTENVDLSPPAHFGEMAILGSGKRSATIEVLEDANALSISADQFRALILDHPAIIFPIVRSLLERLVAKNE